MALTTEEMLKRVYKKWNNKEFVYIEGFNGMKKKCLFKCKNCGNENYFVSPANLLDKKKIFPVCDNCRKYLRGTLTEDEFKEKLLIDKKVHFLLLENIQR